LRIVAVVVPDDVVALAVVAVLAGAALADVSAPVSAPPEHAARYGMKTETVANEVHFNALM
jgi:hypothetical protein